jgi:hypothetical protein
VSENMHAACVILIKCCCAACILATTEIPEVSAVK